MFPHFANAIIVSSSRSYRAIEVYSDLAGGDPQSCPDAVVQLAICKSTEASTERISTTCCTSAASWPAALFALEAFTLSQ